MDDGSTDSSGSICDQYARKDDRIIVIHKKNGGVASARNAALDIYRGEWVMFVDSDDIIDLDACSLLLQYSRITSADIIIGKEQIFYKTNKNPIRAENGSCEVIDSNEALIRIFYNRIPGHTVCTLFKRSIIGDLRFPQGITIGEDTHILTRIIDHAYCIAIVGYTLYYYRQLPNSASHAQYSHKFMSLIDVYDEIMMHFGERSEEMRKAICSKQFFCCASILGIIDDYNKYKMDQLRLFNGVNKTKVTVLFDSNNSLKVRIMALVAMLSPKLLAWSMARWNIIKRKLKV